MRGTDHCGGFYHAIAMPLHNLTYALIMLRRSEGGGISYHLAK